jgi:hypothetical protein
VTIEQLRILPPLAIGRLGAAPTPMDNYDVDVDPGQPLAPRTLKPAPTFQVDATSGEITGAPVPETVTFREGGQVRPVAPFLELWALTSEGTLEPVTAALLEAAGATPADVRWNVHVGNHKLWRRTDQPGDRIEAQTGEFSDNAPHPLNGECANFWPGKTLPLGHVQYIKPTAQFPEIRLRFTPAAGHVYGSSATPPPDGAPSDPNIVEVLYDASPGKGTWLGYADQNVPTVTSPGGIYAQDENGISLGYLDDECDGLVHATLSIAGQTLSAYGRIGAGPPTYAPDRLPVRTVYDELEQALLGPDVAPGEATFEQIEDIVRRAFETIQLLNTDVMNAVSRGGARVNNMVSQDTRDTGRAREPIMAPSLVDDVALENLHQSLLVALRSGTAPWFVDVLRKYDEIGDLSDKGRRKMPALMRNADARALTLTRRQVDLIRTLARGPIFPSDAGAPE